MRLTKFKEVLRNARDMVKKGNSEKEIRRFMNENGINASKTMVTEFIRECPNYIV